MNSPSQPREFLWQFVENFPDSDDDEAYVKPAQTSNHTSRGTANLQLLTERLESIKRRHSRQMLRLTQKHVSDIRELQEDFHRAIDEEYCIQTQVPLRPFMINLMTPQVKAFLLELQDESNKEMDEKELLEKVGKLLERTYPDDDAVGIDASLNKVSLNELNDEYWREYKWMRTLQRSEFERLRLHQLKELQPFYKEMADYKRGQLTSSINQDQSPHSSHSSIPEQVPAQSQASVNTRYPDVLQLLVALKSAVGSASSAPSPQQSLLQTIPSRQDPRLARDPRRNGA